MSVLEIPESGDVSVQVGGAKVSLDVYRVYNEILDLRDKNADADGPVHAFHAAVADHLAGYGLPRLNHFQVDAFVAKLADAVEALKKTLDPGPTPDSPGPSGPPP